MTNIEFAEKAKEIAKLKTLYVNGCFGARMTAVNKQKYISNTAYNRQKSRQEKIKTATEDTYGFDCVNLIKAILWGFPNTKYASNGVPDIGEDNLIKQCSPSKNFNADIPIGAVLWLKGHIGIYIGGGLCVEATPAGTDGVQITCVANIKYNPKYKVNRAWTMWGKLPYLTYEEDEVVKEIEVLIDGQKVKVKAIEKDDTNYVRLRDFDDKLGLATIGYDAAQKIPTIKKK